MRNFTPLKVLIVDDEPLIRGTLRRGLCKRGHTVTEGADAAGALRLAGESPVPFDVLLLDYRLPDRQDLSLLREFRRLSPQTAIVMMTAYCDSRMREEAVDLGARTVIDKPFELGAVIGLVEAVAG